MCVKWYFTSFCLMVCGQSLTKRMMPTKTIILISISPWRTEVIFHRALSLDAAQNEEVDDIGQLNAFL